MTDPVGVIYLFAGFTLDDRTFEIRRGEQRVALERRVFDVVAYLVRHHGRVVSKSELFRAVWDGRIVTDASLSIVISAARKALGDDAIRQAIISTHHGRGYRCIAEVAEVESGALGEEVAALRADPREVFIGRAAELDELNAALATARQGRLRLVLITGEAGIGKTRLVEHHATSRRRSGGIALVARSPEEPGAPAFWPWIQVLRDYLNGISPSDIASFLTRLEDIAHLLPEVRNRLSSSPPPIRDPSQARFRLFDAIATFLDRASKRTPLTIYLDDIHRADEASLLLLSYISTAIPESPLLVVATYRDTHRSTDLPRTAASLIRSPVTKLLRVGGLATDDATDLLEGIAGRHLDRPLLEALYEKSGGNPFFLHQLARHIGDFSGEGATPRLPTDLADAVADQIGDLSEKAKDLLTLAAVAGSDFSLDLLARAWGVRPVDLLPVLQQAIDARVVVRSGLGGRFRFTHALLRDALYQRLADLRRSSLHQQIAHALVESCGGESEPPLSAIAYHFYEASTVGSVQDAIDYERRAGEAASARLAYEDAARHYGRALELLDRTASDDDVARCHLLQLLGAQLIKAGERDRAKAVFDRLARLASRIGESTVLAEAALGIAPGVLALEFGVVDSFQIDLARSALHSLGSSSPPARAKLLARLSLALHWSDDETAMRSALSECAAIAAAVSDVEARAYWNQATWYATRDPRTVLDRSALAQSLARLNSESLEPEFCLVSQLFLLTSLLETGELARFDSELVRFKELADSLRQPQATWYTQMLDGMRSLLSGDFANAERQIERYTALGMRVNDANANHSAIAHTLIIRYARGQLEQLLPAARTISAKYPALVGWRASVPWLLASLGRLDEAANEMSQFCSEDIARIPSRLDWPAVAVLLAESSAMLGDRARARSLYDLILPLENSYAIIGLSVVNWGAFARHLGLLAGCLGRWPDAIRHLEKALAMNERIGAHAWVAHTKVDLAQSLLQSREQLLRRRASQLLYSAQKSAERLGMPALVGRAKTVARAIAR